MATRENFKISFNGTEVVKHKWNSACREVESIIRGIAQNEAQTYELHDKESIKEDSYYVRGHRTWVGANGNTIRFDIEKI